MSAQWSLWLLPSAPQLATLSEVVQRLAPVFGQSAFVPHVTIQGDIDMAPEDLCAVAQGVATSQAVCRWPVQEVEHSEHFFRCLYLRLQADAGFSRMQAAAQAATGRAEGLSPFAHVSLAYGQMPAHGMAGLPPLAQQFAGQTLVLDQLAVYHSSQQVPIAQWTCVARYPLQAAGAHLL